MVVPDRVLLYREGSERGADEEKSADACAVTLCIDTKSKVPHTSTTFATHPAHATHATQA